MEITVSLQKQIAVVVVVGRVDALTGKKFLAALEQEIQKGNYRLVIDLQQVDYLSSAGVHAIVAAARAVRAHQGALGIAGAQPNVARVFELSGLAHLARRYPDVPSALAQLQA